MPAAQTVFSAHAAAPSATALLDDDDDDEPPPLLDDEDSDDSDEDDSDSDDDDNSDDENDGERLVTKKKSKSQLSHSQRTQRISLSDDTWRAGRDLEAALKLPHDMTTYVQTTRIASLSVTLPLARAIMNQSESDTITVPMWRKTAISSNGLAEDGTLTAFERYYKNAKIKSLQDCAADAPPIIASEFEARFFADKLDSDPHMMPQEPPSLPSPETVQYCCAIQGRTLVADMTGVHWSGHGEGAVGFWGGGLVELAVVVLGRTEKQSEPP